MILETLADAFQGEHETELFDALEDTLYGLGRKKGETLHDCVLRVQSNVRKRVKQGVRLPDQVQGSLLLRRTTETGHIDTESHHSTDEQEQNPCDETRDYGETGKGRWVRVHGIARRTLLDPMHDEQPFCQNLTERRGTTVRFSGQQSEMRIGEMRCLWKGTTEFWTQDMIQLFRNHLHRIRDAMSPPFVNTAAQAEHGRRDSLSVMTHTEDAKEKGRRVVFGVARIIQREQHPPRRLHLCHSTSR